MTVPTWFRRPVSFVLVLTACAAGSGGPAAANVVVDFRQSANNETNGTITGLGNIHWINSIVQSSNSKYFEGMSNFQRTVFTTIPATTGNVHTLTLGHQFTKGGIHAYDFLTSFAQGIADDAAALGVPISINSCGDEIGPPGSLGATCNSLHGGLFFLDIDIPDDPYVSKDGSTATKIAAYEATHGNRTVRVYGNAAITSGSMSVSHDVAAGADGGDSYAQYVLTWTSTSTQILIELGGHLANTGDGTGDSWGPGLGSSQINGGPYHFKLSALGGALVGGAQSEIVSLGSQDNQIKGADIKVPCPTCVVSGSTGPVCPGSGPQSYSVTVNGTCSDPSTITWSLSNNTSGASFNGGNTGTTVSVNPGSSCGGFRLTSSFTCSNCIDPVTCFVDVNVDDTTPPVIDPLPGPSTIECPAVPSFATATASDACDPSVTLTFVDATVAGSCPQEYSVTRTWTATDDCGNTSTAGQTISVTDDTAPVITCPSNISVSCNSPVTFATPVTDNCDASLAVECRDQNNTVVHSGDVFPPGTTTVTCTAADDCGNTGTCAFTVTVAPCAQGCTPGFWCGGVGGTLWNTAPNDPEWALAGGQGSNPFTLSTTFEPFFTPSTFISNTATMSDLLCTGGGKQPAEKAARDVIASYLNATFGLSFPLTPAQIAQKWTDAVALGTSQAFLALHNELAPLNEAGCSIGNPEPHASAGGTAVTQFGAESTSGGSSIGNPTSEQPELEPYRPTPNPFTSIMRLAYVVPAGSGERVEVGVYDLTGRRIRSIAGGIMGPGRHEASWDGRDEAGLRVNNGLYFIHTTVGDRRKTVTVVYLR